MILRIFILTELIISSAFAVNDNGPFESGEPCCDDACGVVNNQCCCNRGRVFCACCTCTPAKSNYDKLSYSCICDICSTCDCYPYANGAVGRCSCCSLASGNNSEVCCSICGSASGDNSKVKCGCCASAVGEGSQTSCFCNKVEAPRLVNDVFCVLRTKGHSYCCGVFHCDIVGDKMHEQPPSETSPCLQKMEDNNSK